MTINDDDIPALFRRESVRWWVIAFLIILLVIILPLHLLVFDAVKVEGAVEFLMINAEILVTTMAVTLGATLLGIQFRAQSYTMLALLTQMNEWIVYSFVIIFTGLIIFSMSLVALLPEESLGQFLPYVFLGTSFSMVYLVGYVYHMIHRLQPLQMMQRVTDDMESVVREEATLRGDTGYTIENMMGIRASHGEKFVVWEHIMLRAVEMDNINLFRKGLDRALEIARMDIDFMRNQETNMLNLHREFREFLAGEGEKIRVVRQQILDFLMTIEYYSEGARTDIKEHIEEKVDEIRVIHDGVADALKGEFRRLGLELQINECIDEERNKLNGVPDRVIALMDKDVWGTGNDPEIINGERWYVPLRDRIGHYMLVQFGNSPYERTSGVLHQVLRQQIKSMFESQLFFFRNIEEVMLSCVSHDRHTCSAIFMDKFSADPVILENQLSIQDAYTNMMFEVWSEMMRLAILDDRDLIIHQGMEYFKKLEREMGVAAGSSKTILHNNIAAMVSLAIDKKSNRWLLQYLRIFAETSPENKREVISWKEMIIKLFRDAEENANDAQTPLADTPIIGLAGWYHGSRIAGSLSASIPTPIEAWAMIMSYAKVEKNMTVFTTGIKAMKKVLRMNNTDVKHSALVNALSGTMKDIVDNYSIGSYQTVSEENTWIKTCIFQFVESFADYSNHVFYQDVQISHLLLRSMRKMINDREFDVLKHSLQKIGEFDGSISDLIRDMDHATRTQSQNTDPIVRGLKVSWERRSRLSLTLFITTLFDMRKGAECFDMTAFKAWEEGMITLINKRIDVLPILEQLEESLMEPPIIPVYAVILGFAQRPLYVLREILDDDNYITIEKFIELSDAYKKYCLLSDLFMAKRTAINYNLRCKNTIICNMHSICDARNVELANDCMYYMRIQLELSGHNDLRNSLETQMTILNNNETRTRDDEDVLWNTIVRELEFVVDTFRGDDPSQND